MVLVEEHRKSAAGDRRVRRHLKLGRPADTHGKYGPAGSFDTLLHCGRHRPNRLL